MQRMRRMALRAVAMSLMLTGLTAAPAFSGVSGPTCINYRHDEQYGYVLVDERYDPNSSGITLTIWWYITDLVERPGEYSWSHIINGQEIQNPESAVKDDAFHTVLRMYQNGRTNYSYGDTYRLIGTHASESGNLYVALTNLCTIVRL